MEKREFELNVKIVREGDKCEMNTSVIGAVKPKDVITVFAEIIPELLRSKLEIELLCMMLRSGKKPSDIGGTMTKIDLSKVAEGRGE